MLSSLCPAVAHTNFPELLGKNIIDGARILSLDRLAGEYYSPAVNVAASQPRVAIGVVKKMLQCLSVNGTIGKKRGKQNWRMPNYLPFNNDKAAR